MQNVTGGEASPDTTSDTSALEAKVRNSIAHGKNVREEVRDFTVKALSSAGPGSEIATEGRDGGDERSE